MTLRDALARASEARAALHLPDTDCLRLFHGAVEGAAGLTVDRYGPVLLIQTFRDPLLPAQYDDIVAASLKQDFRAYGWLVSLTFPTAP